MVVVVAAVVVVIVVVVVVVIVVVVATVVGVEAVAVAVGRVVDWKKKERTASPAGHASWPYPSPSTSGGSDSSTYPGPLLQRNKK